MHHMYTVGLDADTFVSILEDILILKIKFLAGNSILNFSPPLLGGLYLIFIYYYLIEKENSIFSDVYINIKKPFCIIVDEVGKICNLLSQFKQVWIVNNTKSADCLLILPWKNEITKCINNLLLMYLLLFKYLIRVLSVLLFVVNFLLYYINISKKLFLSNTNWNTELIIKYQHLNKHRRPESDESFGYYLAGLIEGDGYIGKRSIEISFHVSDSQLAYYIKKRLGFGNVTKYSHTDKAIRYSVWNRDGITKIFNLINGKFFSKYKNDQIRNYINIHKMNFNLLPSMFELYPNNKEAWKDWILSNHWLCGFTDADGSFTINMSKSITHKLGYSLKLEYKIVQKNEDVILGIKETFGGFSYYDPIGLVYRYKFASLKEQHKVIDYFDNFQLNSSKYIRYLKWRKCYRLYLEKQHLVSTGIIKILNIINSLRD